MCFALTPALSREKLFLVGDHFSRERGQEPTFAISRNMSNPEVRSLSGQDTILSCEDARTARITNKRRLQPLWYREAACRRESDPHSVSHCWTLTMAIVASSAKPVRTVSGPGETWRQAMKSAIRDGVRLCRHLEIPEPYVAAAVRAAQAFPVFVPLNYAAKMKRGDAQDPLLRQVLPLNEELHTASGFVSDPVGEAPAAIQPGMLQKYTGRVLLVTTGACAVHCRYCFRRHYPYNTAPPSMDTWQRSLEHIAEDATLEEVILSGGDPLTLSDSILGELSRRLSAIDHVRRLRVHTRLPIVIPQRVTAELVRWLCASRPTCIIVIHANHPAELDQPVAAALSRLVDAGVSVLNQTVLLRGVNDDAVTLAELSRRLVELRVMPYYLHQLDRVSGAGHFEVPVERGIRLIEQLRRELPGYAVPRYVQEVPGEPSKRVLA